MKPKKLRRIFYTLKTEWSVRYASLGGSTLLTNFSYLAQTYMSECSIGRKMAIVNWKGSYIENKVTEIRIQKKRKYSSCVFVVCKFI